MTVCRLGWIIVASAAAWLMLSFGIDALTYEVKSQAASPNGSKTIYEFRSNQDGAGHAPYGTTLALSPGKRIRTPDDGHVVFAGYCGPSLAYRWIDDSKIEVSCRLADGNKGLRTLSKLAYGVEVAFVER